MILELMIAPIFIFIKFLVGLFPTITNESGAITKGFFDFLSMGFYFFGTAPFILVISSVLGWSLFEIGWSGIEWVYKKIPGVD